MIAFREEDLAARVVWLACFITANGATPFAGVPRLFLASRVGA